MKRLLRLPLLLGLVALVGAFAIGCESSSERASRESLAALDTPQAKLAATTAPTRTPNCGDPTASLAPSGTLPPPQQMPAGSFMRRIQRRGRLIAGVDQNTLLFGYLNPANGKIEGFEIDVLRQLANSILGDPNAIEFKAIRTDQRLPFVRDGSVDLVADAVTINCERLREVAFSSVYYEAKQRVLVPSNARARGIQDLGGKRVCATVGSTSLKRVARARSKPIPKGVPARTDCLVALQQGEVDAISSDDAILLGFKAQDPNTKIVGPPLADEPYGVAINKKHPEFVRFVNGVLERMRADGTWARIHRKWLGRLTPTPPPPRARYRG